jgi:glutamyl-tRNA reductase
MFMVDIAVPRDIDADVAELEDVYLFTVDDLQSVVNENLEGRRQAAREAGALIESEVERFSHLLRTRDAAPLIRRLREDADRTRQRTLEQARQMLAHGKSQDEVLGFLANTLTNRLIHAPSQRLRDAAETGDGDVIETIAEIYRLDQPHD